jgi:hypothetical protein
MGKFYQRKKNKLTKLTHILAAFVLLIHGYEKLEEEHATPAVLFIICGLIFLSVAIFHHKLHQKVRSVDAIFAFLEGIAALTLAADFWENKHYLQCAYVLVAVIYLTRSVILFVKGPNHQPAI